MSFELDEIFADFATNLQKNAEELNSQEFVSATPAYSLLPNTVETLEVERPFFLENVLYSDAQVVQDSEKDIQEKYDIPQDMADILDKAHPKPVYVADDTYDGGLVENLDEVHRKHLSVVNKMPSGNHVHLASLIEGLVKIANDLEDAGADLKVIGEVDRMLENIKRATIPLAGGGSYAAFQTVALPVFLAPLIPWVVGAAVVALGAGTIQGILGIQEGLLTDVNDLYGYVKNLPSEYPGMVQATNIATSAQTILRLTYQAKAKVGAAELDLEYFTALGDIGDELNKITANLNLLESQTSSSNPLRFVPTRGAIDNVRASIVKADGGARAAAETPEATGLEKAITPSQIDVKEPPEGISEAPVVPAGPKSEQEIRKIQQFINQNFQTVYGTQVLSDTVPVSGEFTEKDEDDPTWAAMRAIASFTRNQFASGPESLGEVTPSNLAKLDLTGWERFFEGHRNAQRIMLGESGITVEPVK